MNKFTATTTATVLGLLLWGCGSSTNNSLTGAFTNSTQTSTAGAQADSVITGKVVDSNGVPQGGVRVVVQERSNNFHAIGASAPDGTFQFNVVAGVYDLGLDKEGDASTATCYYGPVMSGAAPQNFVLQSAGGRTNERLFGKILLQPGTPASGRQLVLRPGFWTGNEKEHSVVTVTTGADGTFDTALKSSQQAGLDLEIYEGNGALGEFVDIEKLAKPCYVEFVSQQTSVKNRLRANQADLTPRAASPVASRASASTLVQFQLATSVKSKYQFLFGVFQNAVFLDFTNGVLPPDGEERALSELTQGSFIPQTAPKGALQAFTDIRYLPTTIRLSNGAWLWSPYTVSVYSLPAVVWDFQDQSGKKIHLETSSSSNRGITYKASYSSPEPALKAISCYLVYSQTDINEGEEIP